MDKIQVKAFDSNTYDIRVELVCGRIYITQPHYNDPSRDDIVVIDKRFIGGLIEALKKVSGDMDDTECGEWNKFT